MVKIDQAFFLSFWKVTASGYNETHADKLQNRYEKKGWISYCISDESRYEKKCIEKFIKENGGKTNFVKTKTEMCSEGYENWGIFHIPSRCVFVHPSQEKNFENFMNSIPRRKNQIILKMPINPILKSMISGLNYKISIPEIDEQNKNRAILTIQDFPKMDNLKVFVAIS